MFSYRAGGFTVITDAPLTAYRTPSGSIAVHLTSRSASTEYLEEFSTLPGLDLELAPDAVVGVKLYDEGGRIVFAPAAYLLQVSNGGDLAVALKMMEAMGLGFGLGAEVLSAGIEARLLARVLVACDRAALGLGVVASIVNEHRGWILSRFGEQGRSFLRVVDGVNSVVAFYGIARLAMAAPKLVLQLRGSFGNVLSKAKSIDGWTPEETQALQRVREPMEQLLRELDEIQASQGPGASGATQTPAGAKVIPLDSARKPGTTPESAARPVAVPDEQPLAMTGTGDRVAPIRRQVGQGSGGPVASVERGPDNGVEPRMAPPSSHTGPAASSNGGNRPAGTTSPRQEAPRLTVIPGGIPIEENLSAEEYAARRFLELERGASRRIPGTRQELEAIRPRLEQRPPDVTQQETLWADYVKYYDTRLEELGAYEKGLLKKPPQNPIPWEAYQFFKTNVNRGYAFENRITELMARDAKLPFEQRVLIREVRNFRLDRRVGIFKKGFENVLYVDHMVVDLDSLGPGKAPRAECYSEKSPTFNQMSNEEVADLVNEHITELQMKYGGSIEVRRPGPRSLGGKWRSPSCTLCMMRKRRAEEWMWS